MIKKRKKKKEGKKGRLQANGKPKHYSTQKVKAENGSFALFPFVQ